MDEKQFIEWFAERQKVESDNALWPYLKWRYEKEAPLKITANEWAFPYDWIHWAEMQLAQRAKPWQRPEESLEHRRKVLQKLRDKGLLPPDANTSKQREDCNPTKATLNNTFPDQKFLKTLPPGARITAAPLQITLAGGEVMTPDEWKTRRQSQ